MKGSIMETWERRWLTAVLVGLMLTLALASQAAVDLGNGACQQSDGQVGLWNGTDATDEGCVTLDEYAAQVADPDTTVVAVNPQLEPEPEAPTVREVFESPQVRASLLGLIIE